MSRYSAIARARFRLDRAEAAWTELVAIIAEAAETPGYSGPSPSSVEKVADEIAATRVALGQWIIAARRGRPFSGVVLRRRGLG